MSSTTTQTTIINRALQLLGYKAVGSISDNDRGAKAMNRAYQPVLLAMLRENFWGFSIVRAILAASATTPIFGKAKYYPLPGDFLMLAPPDQDTAYVLGALAPIPSARNNSVQYTDFQIEQFNGGLAIASDMTPPINIRYVTSNVTESIMDPAFCEAFSACLAMDTCEELTQSNTKMANAEKMYDSAMNEAKKRNAFEMMPVQAPIDPWILVRM
jgi:hypothetical protein